MRAAASRGRAREQHHRAPAPHFHNWRPWRASDPRALRPGLACRSTAPGASRRADRQGHLDDVFDAPRAGRHGPRCGRQRDRLVEAVRHDTMVRIGAPRTDEPFSHEEPRLLVERAEGLVHQEDRRVERERPCDGNPLAHAARELARVLGLEAFGPMARADRARSRAAGLWGTPSSSRPKPTLSSAVRHGKSPGSWKTRATFFGFGPDTASPSIRMRPESGRTRPPIMPSTVDLPQPLGPGAKRTRAGAREAHALDGGNGPARRHVALAHAVDGNGRGSGHWDFAGVVIKARRGPRGSSGRNAVTLYCSAMRGRARLPS